MLVHANKFDARYFQQHSNPKANEILHALSFNGNKMFTPPTMILMMTTTLSNEMHNIKLLLDTLRKTQIQEEKDRHNGCCYQWSVLLLR